MGVRLYPITKQGISQLEVFNKVAPLLGWSSLSNERFEVFQTLESKLKSDEISSDDYFETLYNGSNGDIKKYSAFTLFGFGKFRSMFPEHQHYVGSEHNPKKVRYLCLANDIPEEVMEVIDGFYWG